MGENRLASRLDLPVAPEVQDERRVFARFITDSAVRIKEPHKEDIYKGTCKDISAGGARVITGKKLRSDDKVELWVNVPSLKKPLRLVGNVRWLKELSPDVWDTGINFQDVDFMTLAPFFRTF